MSLRALAIALLLIVPAPMQAQDAQHTAAARALFDEGLELARAERWEEAADRFRRALELRPAPPVRFNLGLALVRVGQLVEGTELLLSVERDESVRAPMRREAAVAGEAARQRIGRLTVRLAQGARGEVFVDDRAWAAALVGVATPADPGSRRVTLVADGRTIARATVEVPEGGSVEVTLQPQVASPREVAEVAVTEEEPPPVVARPLVEEWWFWTAIGGAVVVAIAVVVGAIVASSAPSPVSGNFDPPFLDVVVMP